MNSMIKSLKDEANNKLVLGRYRIVKKLAEGGMGVVYLARSEGAAGFVKPVVVKSILPFFHGQSDYVDMFIREAKILSRVQDSGVVNVIEFSEDDNRYFMVLEYVHGFSLAQWLVYLRHCERRLPTEVGIQIILEVLDTLHHIQSVTLADGTRAEIVHRDINPTNILIDIAGRVKLLDFGIARMKKESSDEYRTEEGVLKGKLAYCPPENLSNGVVTPLSDIYACGLVLHEMMVGRNQFKARDHAAVIYNIIKQTLSPVGRMRDDSPPGLDKVIAKATHKDPQERYQSAEDFSTALRAIRNGRESEWVAKLRELVKEDFDTEMAALLGVDPLAERERAWREPSLSSESLSFAPSDPTVIYKAGTSCAPDITPVERPCQPSNMKKKSLSGGVIPAKILIASVLALTAAIAIGLFWGSMSNQKSAPVQEPNNFVVVQSPFEKVKHESTEENSLASTDPAPKSDLVQKPDPKPLSKGATAGQNRPHKAAGEPTMAQYSKIFEKRKKAIRRCFNTHQEDIEGKPEVSVLFKVNSSGEVTNAEILPPQMTRSRLGKCLISVARSTTFTSRNKPVAFMIPITASRL